MALICLVTYSVGQPLLVLMMERYSSGLPETTIQQLQDPRLDPVLARSTLFIAYALIVHAAVVAWTALRLNKW